MAVASAAAAALAIAGWSSVGDPAPPSAPAEVAAKASPHASHGKQPASEASARRRSRHDGALTLDVPRGSSPVVWVRAGARVEMRTAPGGRGKLVERVGRRTEFGSPSVFGVVRRRGDWAAVSTASLPNGKLGWVKLDPARLRAGSTRTSIVVDLSERRAELYRADRLVDAFTVTVGAPESPTPTGRFAVTDTFRGDLSPDYGCCALALSATQPHLPSGWLGGRRIAIHGTSARLGKAASNGCVRAADADVSKLVRRVELGTPVVIRA